MIPHFPILPGQLEIAIIYFSYIPITLYFPIFSNDSLSFSGPDWKLLLSLFFPITNAHELPLNGVSCSWTNDVSDHGTLWADACAAQLGYACITALKTQGFRSARSWVCSQTDAVEGERRVRDPAAGWRDLRAHHRTYVASS
jgi:hypothetical protein